jgi:hypothetical protein
MSSTSLDMDARVLRRKQLTSFLDIACAIKKYTIDENTCRVKFQYPGLKQ